MTLLRIPKKIVVRGEGIISIVFHYTCIILRMKNNYCTCIHGTTMNTLFQDVVGKPGPEYPLGVGSGYTEAILATMEWSVEVWVNSSLSKYCSALFLRIIIDPSN